MQTKKKKPTPTQFVFVQLIKLTLTYKFTSYDDTLRHLILQFVFLSLYKSSLREGNGINNSKKINKIQHMTNNFFHNSRKEYAKSQDNMIHTTSWS